MENKIKNVSLSFCCKKDWNTFKTIDERKRFCDSCQHNVVDFTTATQTELDDALKSGERVCGRFTAVQLSDTFRKYAASTVVAAAAILSTSCEKPVNVKPLDPPELAVPEELPALEEHEFVTMGIVFIPRDSVAIDTTLQVTTDHHVTE